MIRELQSQAADSCAANAANLHGIVPPMVTPLRNSSELDEAGTRRLIRHLLQGGVHGIFILGTTGEGPNLNEKAKRQLIDITCREVENHIPVIVGISDSSFDESIRLANFCSNKGVTACAVTPPFYFPCSQDEIVDFYERFGQKLPLPFIVYDIPSLSKSHVAVETLKRILDIDNLLGIKDSSGNMAYHHQLLSLRRHYKPFLILIGSEELLADSVLFGGDGGICGGANVLPELYVDIYETAQRRDTEALIELQDKMLQLGKIYSLTESAGSNIKGIKCALQHMGICGNTMTEPFSSYSKPQQQQISSLLKDLKLIGETS